MKLANVLFILSLFILAAPSQAATHTITFANFSYTPQALQASVGDVIRWEGDFQAHPLESLNVPNGAAPFSHSEGTSFEYTITVAGNYAYRCTNHFTQGMVGGFNAAESSVGDEFNVEALLQLQAFPNPASSDLTVSYTLGQGGNVRITLVDINGRDLYQIDNVCVPGKNTTFVNVASLPLGTYYYRIETADAVLSRKFVVAR
jgi:plastocyanin